MRPQASEDEINLFSKECGVSKEEEAVINLKPHWNKIHQIFSNFHIDESNILIFGATFII